MKILIPKEHGAWAMLYAPLIVALVVSRAFSYQAVLLIIAITALFFAHSPLFILARLHRNQPDSAEKFRDAKRWLIIYGFISVTAAAPLVFIDHLWLLVPFGGLCALLLAYQTYVSAKREEKNVIAEFLVVISLTSSAPAFIYVATHTVNRFAILLWILSVLFFASSIFYVKMRVSRHVKRIDSTAIAAQCAVYHLFVCMVILFLVWQKLVPALTFLAFVPILLRTLWSFQSAPQRLSLKRIGLAEILWTSLFVVILSLTF